VQVGLLTIVPREISIRTPNPFTPTAYAENRTPDYPSEPGWAEDQIVRTELADLGAFVRIPEVGSDFGDLSGCMKYSGKGSNFA